MPPKIPQLHRENASLRQETPDPRPPLQEASPNQKVPQTHTSFVSAKKVWWDDQKKSLERDLNQKEEHDAPGGQH